MDKRIRALSAEQAIEAMDLNFECGNGDCTFSGLKKDLEKHEETCEDDDEYEDVDDSDEEPNQSLDSAANLLTLLILGAREEYGEAWHRLYDEQEMQRN